MPSTTSIGLRLSTCRPTILDTSEHLTLPRPALRTAVSFPCLSQTTTSAVRTVKRSWRCCLALAAICVVSTSQTTSWETKEPSWHRFGCRLTLCSRSSVSKTVVWERVGCCLSFALSLAILVWKTWAWPRTPFRSWASPKGFRSCFVIFCCKMFRSSRSSFQMLRRSFWRIWIIASTKTQHLERALGWAIFQSEIGPSFPLPYC